ncbi:inositol monophosphatase [Rhodobacterales bacterium HKCCE2091]|nr:inositol monophosphatase [Rhodobacterales bacterium HKCCE2091]
MPVSEASIAALIDGVRETARREIMPRFRNLDAAEIGTKSAPDDLVTVADQASEAAITDIARRIFPGVEVVGEEAVAENPALLDRIEGAETCVIVDPIDGTLNFVEGISVFGVIVAVVERGETQFGLLYDPVNDDWVAGAKGQGAWFGRPDGTRRPLRTRAAPVPAAATGLLGLRLYAPEYRGRLMDAYSGFRLVRALGASCHDYRQVAMGQTDFAVSAGMKPWDHAAGVLILEEAGGAVQVGEGGRYAPHLSEGPILATGDATLLPAIAAAQAVVPGSRVG